MKRLLQRIVARIVGILRRQEASHTIHCLEERGLLDVGRWTYGVPAITSYRGSEARITIGSFSSIAPNVRIINGGIHPRDWISTFPFRIAWNMEGAFQDGIPTTRGDIVIGSDVWIGTEAMILSGVTIGHGAIVAARSVVTRDVPPYAIVAGSPAKPLGHRFPPEVVERLLEIAWWNWDDERIREAIPLLSSPNIDLFLQQYGSTERA